TNRMPSGVAASQLPTASTVTFASCFASMSSTCRVIDTGPAPWKVSAISGDPDSARTNWVAAPPGGGVEIVEGEAGGAGETTPETDEDGADRGASHPVNTAALRPNPSPSAERRCIWARSPRTA